MSAKWDPKDDWVYLGVVKNDETRKHIAELVSARFEMESLMDAMAIQKSLVVDSFYRRACFIRMVTFPIEVVLTVIMFNPAEARHRWAVQKAMWKFFFKKIKRPELAAAIAKMPL